MYGITEKRLVAAFKTRKSFSREELFAFFRRSEPDLNEGTFGWRIHDLKNKDILKSLKRGLYTVSFNPKYKPQISPELAEIAGKINEKYKEISYCIWSTAWVNTFAQHQSAKSILLVEIEKEFVESLYYYLKDIFDYEIYLNPGEKEINFYIAESKYPVVIKKLISRSPVTHVTECGVAFSIPAIEKILVDLYAEEKLFYFFQGSELKRIYENAIKYYAVNFTRLFSYARRREKEKDLKSYLKKIPSVIKDLIDD